MMFPIYVRTLNGRGEVENTEILQHNFKERKDAVARLNGMVDRLKPKAGYDDKHDLWWTRVNEIVVHYTIGA